MRPFAVVIALVAVAVGGLALWDRSGTISERKGSTVGEKVIKTDAEWQAQLTDEQYRVTRRAGTERPFTGEYWNTTDDGIYHCICCGQPLFDARNKFHSECGWPSFYSPADEEHITYRRDDSHFMNRIEIVCSRCDAHLGHVFDDGPPPTGRRYCINSASLKLMPRGDAKSAP